MNDKISNISVTVAQLDSQLLNLALSTRQLEDRLTVSIGELQQLNKHVGENEDALRVIVDRLEGQKTALQTLKEAIEKLREIVSTETQNITKTVKAVREESQRELHDHISESLARSARHKHSLDECVSAVRIIEQTIGAWSGTDDTISSRAECDETKFLELQDHLSAQQEYAESIQRDMMTLSGRLDKSEEGAANVQKKLSWGIAILLVTLIGTILSILL